MYENIHQAKNEIDRLKHKIDNLNEVLKRGLTEKLESEEIADEVKNRTWGEISEDQMSFKILKNVNQSSATPNSV